MRTTAARFIDSIPSITGMGFSIFGLWTDSFGGGNPDHAILWAITFFIWALIMKIDGDRERTKEVTDRLDILARVLLPEFCKGNNAIESYKKLMGFKGPNTWEDLVKDMKETKEPNKNVVDLSEEIKLAEKILEKLKKESKGL